MIVETNSGFRRLEIDSRPYCERCGRTEGIAKPVIGPHSARLECGKCGRLLKRPGKTVPVCRTLPGGDNGAGYRTW
jgi:ribosomal protein S27AE